MSLISPRAGRSRRDQDDRGLTDSLQWTIATPLIMLCILGTIQAGLLLHGRSTVRQAAAAAAEVEAVSQPGSEGASAAAQQVAQAGGLTAVRVQVNRSPAAVDVVVIAAVPVFFDIGQGQVSGHASMPREKETTNR